MSHRDTIAIIADDYTGAGDAGIHFARFGRKVELLLHADALGRQAEDGIDVAITTESRFLEDAAAAAKVRDVAKRVLDAGYRRLFKKIDSTMRGNPGAEIEAALSATGQAAALVCTAMPRTGRTCMGGIIHIDGVPLHLTGIGRDPFHPLASSKVADLIAVQSRLPVGFLTLSEVEAGPAAIAAAIECLLGDGVRLIVADAVEERHLAALAGRLADGALLPVGAGGFAEALARVVAPEGTAAVVRRAPDLRRPIVSVVGSMTDISRRQADHAERSGRFRIVEFGADLPSTAIAEACAARLGGPEFNEPNVLVRVRSGANGGAITKESGERTAEKLGLATASVCALLPCRTVFSTGGSTSMAVAEALGIVSVDLVDEILPGVVVGACRGATSGVEWFISKAGGFGEENLLSEIDARCT
jgi:uncharacterized protein YgbK (DUF1537 family)